MTRFRLNRLEPFFFLAAMLAVLSSFGGEYLAAQSGSTTSSTDGSTPLGLNPGAPLGSFPLSGFENINLYNGNLNFRLPLLQLMGRGDARMAVTLPIEMKWRVEHITVPNPPFGESTHYYYPVPDWWSIRRFYGPGLLVGRYSGEGVGCPVYPNLYTSTLTRLTFTSPDGTEYDLRDQATDGKPTPYCQYLSPSFNRGSVFVTADGTSATFYSDSNIFDNVSPGTLAFYPSGTLVLKDGTRMRIDTGTVSYMHDRNGNRFEFVHDATKRVTSIKDSLNRQVTISYGNPETITFKTYGGVQKTLQVLYEPLSALLRTGYTLQTYQQLFGAALNGSTQTYNPNLVSRVTLPTGQEYRFRYNSHGELARVELPTGGAIEYDQDGGLSSGAGVIDNGGIPQEKAIYRRLIERREYPDGSTLGLKTTYSRPANTSPTVAVVDRLNSAGQRIGREQHTFEGRTISSFWKTANAYAPWKEGRETKGEKLDTNGTSFLRRTENTWAQGRTVSWWTGPADQSPAGDPRLTQTLDWLLDNTPNLVAKKTFAYDAYNNVTEVFAYDYGSGTPPTYARRRTVTSYITTNVVDGVTKYYDTTSTIHIRDLPKEGWVYTVNPANGAQTLVSRTRFNYDRYDATTNHAALVNRTSISGLQTGYTTTWKTRGNATSMERWLNTTSSWVTGWSQYDMAGNVVKTIDSRNYATVFDYTDNFGVPNGEARTNTAPLELGTLKSFALVSKVTNPLSQISYTQYDYYLGKPVDEEDANAKVTRTSYDVLGRLRQKTLPDGGLVDAYFSDTSLTATHRGAAVFQTPATMNPLRSKVFTRIETSFDQVGWTVYDGFGRVKLNGSSNGTNIDWTRSEYDNAGRLWRTSNPVTLNATSDDPAASNFVFWTSRTYDALDRLTVVTTPDGQTATNSYATNMTTLTDPLLSKRKLTHDGLGRLTTTVENNETTGSLTSGHYTTSYTYDGADQLTQVSQGSQTRSFVFDTLGRLTSETHPEWGVQGTSGGTTSYSYDSASNLLSKTDARGVTVSYNSYDGLNRPASISYSDGTATASFTYDSTGVTHGKGRRTGMSDGSGSTTWHYDALGRTSKILRTVSGASPPTPNPLTGEFIYNLAGGIKESRWPGIWDGSTPLTIYWSYDNSGRQVSANWSNNGGGASQNLVNSSTFNHYNYPGKGQGNHSREITTYSNNAVETITYNYRMQPNWREVKDGAGLTVMLLEYNYNRNTPGKNDGKNNGNVFNVYDKLNAARDQAYAYDYLNRVTSYTGTLGGSMTFAYDRYGNRPTQTGSGEAPSKSLTISAAQNRIISSGYFYDNTGNMKDEPGWTYQYDAENRMKTVNSGTIATYSYDGDGKRTKKVTAAETRFYYYDQDGRPIWEYKTGYGFETYNFYFNGQHAASNNSGNGLLWLHSDHLGSPRVKTKPNGQILTDASGQPIHDRYYPFGQQINVPADSVKYRFTSQERDGETGLDNFAARHFGNHLGRFMSADLPGVDQSAADPASWNLFSYARNNPLILMDPTGRACVRSSNGWADDDNGGQSCAEAEAEDRAREENGEYDAVVHGDDVTERANRQARLLFEIQSRARLAKGTVDILGTGLLAFTGAATAVGFGGFVLGSSSLTALGIGGAAAINIPPDSLRHVINSHTSGGIRSAGKSIFSAGENIVQLIIKAQGTSPVQQSRGNLERIVNAGRPIGIDRNTKQLTSIYTVITDKAGNLVTAFPGRP